jgi:hypothetical protein
MEGPPTSSSTPARSQQSQHRPGRSDHHVRFSSSSSSSPSPPPIVSNIYPSLPPSSSTPSYSSSSSSSLNFQFPSTGDDHVGGGNKAWSFGNEEEAIEGEDDGRRSLGDRNWQSEDAPSQRYQEQRHPGLWNASPSLWDTDSQGRSSARTSTSSPATSSLTSSHRRPGARLKAEMEEEDEAPPNVSISSDDYYMQSPSRLPVRSPLRSHPAAASPARNIRELVTDEDIVLDHVIAASLESSPPVRRAAATSASSYSDDDWYTSPVVNFPSPAAPSISSTPSIARGTSPNRDPHDWDFSSSSTYSPSTNLRPADILPPINSRPAATPRHDTSPSSTTTSTLHRRPNASPSSQASARQSPLHYRPDQGFAEPSAPPLHLIEEHGQPRQGSSWETLAARSRETFASTESSQPHYSEEYDYLDERPPMEASPPPQASPPRSPPSSFGTPAPWKPKQHATSSEDSYYTQEGVQNYGDNEDDTTDHRDDRTPTRTPSRRQSASPATSLRHRNTASPSPTSTDDNGRWEHRPYMDDSSRSRSRFRISWLWISLLALGSIALLFLVLAPSILKPSEFTIYSEPRDYSEFRSTFTCIPSDLNCERLDVRGKMAKILGTIYSTLMST